MDTYIVKFDEQKEGVYAISLVENPAIEVDFIALSKQEIVKMASVDEEKRLLISPVLIPDQPILRVDDFGNPYNIVFPAETIRQAQQNFYKQGFQSNSTLEHNEEMKLSDVTFVESWIKEDEQLDKSVKYGFNQPVGTWFAIMKVENDEVWAKVKSGEVKGFSIDGVFELEQLKLNKEMSNTAIVEKIKNLIEKVDSKNVELKSEKIQMALVDDIKTLQKDAFSLKQQTSLLQSIQSKLDKSYSTYKTMFASSNDAINKAKDLGIDFKSFSDLKNEADFQMKNILKAISSINEAIKSLNN